MSTLKTGFALLTIILLTIAGTEGLLRIVFAIHDSASDQVATSDIDERALLPAYRDADYDPVELWREIWAGTNVWLAYEPYTVWSRKPVTGKYVNVNRDGHRVTTDNSTDPDALKIWMFGGSTTWGMAVPDAYTLPSYLTRRFNDAGIPTVVSNYGETGYISTQDLLALIRALQGDEKPDLVVFYEGANEPLGLIDQPHMVTPHYLINRIRDLFEGRATTRHPALTLLHESALFRLATSISHRIGLIRPDAAVATFPSALEDIPAVAATAARAYENNLQIVTALADEFGFRPYFFWQPRLGVGKKPLDPTETELLEQIRNIPQRDWKIRFSNELRARVDEANRDHRLHPHFHDIADVFSATPAPVYVDWVHVSHTGNALLADRIFAGIRAETCASPNRKAIAPVARPDSTGRQLTALCKD